VARVIDKPLLKNGDAMEERKLLFQVIRMLLAEGARMSSAMTDGFSFHYLFVYCIGPRRVKHRCNEARPGREEGHFLFLASTISSTDSASPVFSYSPA
jgi:hypothetical protein